MLYMNYDESDYREIKISSLSSATFVSSYAPGLTSGQATAFESFNSKRIGYDSELTDNMEAIYNAMTIYGLGLTKASAYTGGKWPGNDYLRLALVGISTETPSGNIVVENNNYVSRDMRVFIISQYGDYSQIYPSTTTTLHVSPLSNTSSECLNVKEDTYHTIQPLVITVTSILAVVNLLLLCLTLFLLIRHRDHRLFRAFTTEHNYPILVALLLFMAFPYLLYPPNEGNADFLCKFRVIYASFSMILLLASMSHKTFKIMFHAKKGRVRKLPIPLWETGVIFVIDFIVDMIYVTIWLVVSPPEYEVVIYEEGSTYFMNQWVKRCSTNNWSIVNIGLIDFLWLCTFFISYYYRTAGNRYGDTLSQALANGVITFIGVAVAICGQYVTNDPSLNDGLTMIGTEVTVLLTFCTLLGPKVWKIVTKEGILSTTSSDSSYGSTTKTHRTKSRTHHTHRTHTRNTKSHNTKTNGSRKNTKNEIVSPPSTSTNPVKVSPAPVATPVVTNAVTPIKNP